MKLPEKFQFYHVDEGILYSANVNGEDLFITWTIENSQNSSTGYTVKEAEDLVKRGLWKVVKENPLTPEQLRSNAEFREQIAALDHSIRLAYQDIEHKQKLINSYLARQGELSSKLVKES